jgi:hypothetical protein
MLPGFVAFRFVKLIAVSNDAGRFRFGCSNPKEKVPARAGGIFRKSALTVSNSLF